MKYDQALITILHTEGLDVLKRPFHVRSVLSDLVGNSFNDKILIDIYSSLNLEGTLFNCVVPNFASKTEKNLFLLVDNAVTRFSKDQMLEAIAPIISYLYTKDWEKNDIYYNAKISGDRSVYLNEVIVNMEDKKMVKEQSQINQFVIEANCKSLTISKNKDDKILLYANDKLVKPNKYLTISKGSAFIKIKNVFKNYTLELPIKNPSNTTIQFNGKQLLIADERDNKNSLMFNNLNIKTSKSTVKINAKIKEFKLDQEAGKANINSLHVEGKKFTLNFQNNK